MCIILSSFKHVSEEHSCLTDDKASIEMPDTDSECNLPQDFGTGPVKVLLSLVVTRLNRLQKDELTTYPAAWYAPADLVVTEIKISQHGHRSPSPWQGPSQVSIDQRQLLHARIVSKPCDPDRKAKSSWQKDSTFTKSFWTSCLMGETISLTMLPTVVFSPFLQDTGFLPCSSHFQKNWTVANFKERTCKEEQGKGVRFRGNHR